MKLNESEIFNRDSSLSIKRMNNINLFWVLKLFVVRRSPEIGSHSFFDPSTSKIQAFYFYGVDNESIKTTKEKYKTKKVINQYLSFLIEKKLFTKKSF
jgi:hypothetical protein